MSGGFNVRWAENATKQREAAEASASALRDRVAVLESALKASEYLNDRYRRCHAGKPVRDLDEAEAAFAAARAALNGGDHV